MHKTIRKQKKASIIQGLLLCNGAILRNRQLEEGPVELVIPYGKEPKE